MEPVCIVEETDDLLVLNKPAGLIVHSDGRTVEPSLAEWVAEHYPALAGVGEPWVSPQGESIPVCGIVHRLDRTTSGVVLAAKTPDMFSYLKQEFKERRVAKAYRAFVYGHMESGTGRIVAEIARTSEAPKRWYAKPCEESDTRAAITDWAVLDRRADPATGEAVSLLDICPLTGRTHQIRVHLASIGHPIIGDYLYASESPLLLGFARPALHASEIAFEWKGMRCSFAAPLPDDFVRVIAEIPRGGIIDT